MITIVKDQIHQLAFLEKDIPFLCLYHYKKCPNPLAL